MASNLSPASHSSSNMRAQSRTAGGVCAWCVSTLQSSMLTCIVSIWGLGGSAGERVCGVAVVCCRPQVKVRDLTPDTDLDKLTRKVWGALEWSADAMQATICRKTHGMAACACVAAQIIRSFPRQLDRSTVKLEQVSLGQCAYLGWARVLRPYAAVCTARQLSGNACEACTH